MLGQLVLPVVTLGLFGVGPIARMTRASLIEVLASDYVRTARAAGLPPRQVLWTYAFRNALVPILNTVGMVFSFLLGANVLVEKVFGWPGVGAYAIDALLASDFAPVQGFVVVMAFFYLVVNLGHRRGRRCWSIRGSPSMPETRRQTISRHGGENSDRDRGRAAGRLCRRRRCSGPMSRPTIRWRRRRSKR